MSPSIAHVTYLVHDYDEAIAFFIEKLNFTLLEDTLLSDKKRWVLVVPQGGNSSALLLAKADSPEQSQHIGNQTGGRVAFFLHTDDFQRDHQYMLSKGVQFAEVPRHESNGIVAVFFDFYGNKWDLLELKTRSL